MIGEILDGDQEFNEPKVTILKCQLHNNAGGEGSQSKQAVLKTTKMPVTSPKDMQNQISFQENMPAQNRDIIQLTGLQKESSPEELDPRQSFYRQSSIWLSSKSMIDKNIINNVKNTLMSYISISNNELAWKSTEEITNLHSRQKNLTKPKLEQPMGTPTCRSLVKFPSD
jgi:hypothetical protein